MDTSFYYQSDDDAAPELWAQPWNQVANRGLWGRTQSPFPGDSPSADAQAAEKTGQWR